MIIFLCILFIFAFIPTASAAGLNKHETEILSLIKAKSNVKGQQASFSANYINQLENYFLRTELTPEQYNTAFPLFQKSIKAIEANPNLEINSNGTFKLSTLTATTRKLLLKNAVSIGNAFNLVVTFDGQSITAIDKYSGETMFTNIGVIKNTGSTFPNLSIIFFSICLTLFSVSSIIIYRKIKARGYCNG